VRMAINQIDTRLPTISQPPDPAVNATLAETKIWGKKLNQYVKWIDQRETSIQTLYSLVWDQCTDAMQAKVEADAGFNALSTSNDGIELLKIIKRFLLISRVRNIFFVRCMRRSVDSF
jgi:hypothetical protein